MLDQGHSAGDLVELILGNLALCALGWAGSLALLRARRTFYRWFLVLLMSIWLYVSLMLLLVFVVQPPLYCLLGCAGLPLFVVAYGYRVFDYYRKRAQAGEVVPVKVDGWLEETP